MILNLELQLFSIHTINQYTSKTDYYQSPSHFESLVALSRSLSFYQW